MTDRHERRTSIQSLPWEIISNILTMAADANISEGYTPSYTYGLSQVTRTLQLHHKVQVHKHLTGRVPSDTLRWSATDAIRRTCAAWHEWAMGYNMKELYVRRWRGGESWDSKFLALSSPSGGPLTSDIFPVVYQDPYRILKSTVSLLQRSPELNSHVRRLWFSGIYQHVNVAHIFEIVSRCDNVRSLTLPWSALRYGTVEAWVHITNNLPRLTSLEFLGTDLERTQISGDPSNEVNHKALEDVRVDFSKLRRLKLHGSSNVQPIVDADLWEIARTATNLEEVHITGTSSVTIEGITALVSSSHKTLKVLNYAPLDLTTAGFTHRNPSPGMPKIHLCDIITSCPHLTDVNVTIPHICEKLLCPPPQYSDGIMALDTSQPELKWRGTATIRLPHGGLTCVHPEFPLEHPDNLSVLQSIFCAARRLQQQSRDLLIELVIGKYTFNPATFSVSGDFREPKKVAEGMWLPECETESRKGPWGSTGVWEDMGEKGWTEIGEESFFDGVRCGLVRFEN